MAYTKLFNSIITSTIWSEDDKTRIVWISMLALADKNGEVQGSIPGLARIAGVGVEDCRKAITKFLSPDIDSRTKDDEGRRIEEIDGGWSLLNHRKYREMASDADRAEKAALRQQRKRERDKRNVTHPSRNSHASVTPESHQIPQAEAEAEAYPFKEDIVPHSFDLEIQKSQKPDPQRVTIGKLLGRRESTKWSAEEIRLLKSIGTIHPDDMALMQEFYGAKLPAETDYRRTTIERLLKHWNGELDKARAFKLSKR